METIILDSFGATLSLTSERLVVRGPKPRRDAVDTDQMWLPFEWPRDPTKLSILTTSGEKTAPAPLRLTAPKPGAKAPKEEIEIALLRLSEVVIASRGISLSSDIIEACCERGIRVCFLGRNGEPFALLSSPMLTATVATRREQILAWGDERGAELARAFVTGKLRNQAALLKYFGKYQKTASPETFDVIKTAVADIGRAFGAAKRVEGKNADEVRPSLMGLEGTAGRAYWKAVRALVPDVAGFSGREHRGALDPVNAALNYGYGILYGQVWGAVMNAGLEPFAGYMHVDRPGKPSLVLDLVEEFRQPIVDRAVLTLFTTGQKVSLDKGMLDEASRRLVATAVLARLSTEAEFRGRRAEMRSFIQKQSRAVAAFLRGGPRYRAFPFKW